MIRYLKITLVDGTRFILRVSRESPNLLSGIEVNTEGDEVVPPGHDRRQRFVAKALIKKAVELRMNKKYATLEDASRPQDASTAKIVNIVTDTTTLADAVYPAGGLSAFNTGVYEGTRTPIRKLTGREVVTVAGTTAGAKVISDETWIADRFGELGARQIKKLRELTTKESAR
jgi:cyanophycinase-like exopeptidase